MSPTIWTEFCNGGGLNRLGQGSIEACTGRRTVVQRTPTPAPKDLGDPKWDQRYLGREGRSPVGDPLWTTLLWQSWLPLLMVKT